LCGFGSEWCATKMPADRAGESRQEGVSSDTRRLPRTITQHRFLRRQNILPHDFFDELFTAINNMDVACGVALKTPPLSARFRKLLSVPAVSGLPAVKTRGAATSKHSGALKRDSSYIRDPHRGGDGGDVWRKQVQFQKCGMFMCSTVAGEDGCAQTQTDAAR